MNEFLDIFSILFLIFYSLYVQYKLNYPASVNLIGFFCNDQSLKYPFVERIVPGKLLMMASVLSPLIIIWIVNSIFGGSYLLNMIKKWLFLWASTFAMTTFIKSSVPRLRPHFWSVIEPLNINCGDDNHVHKFVTKYESLNFKTENGRQVNQSFCSGHASLGLSSAIFSICFIHNYVNCGSLIKNVVQIFIFMIGLYPGLSQYICHQHHASDVIVGYIVGITTSLSVFFFTLDSNSVF